MQTDNGRCSRPSRQVRLISTEGTVQTEREGTIQALRPLEGAPQAEEADAIQMSQKRKVRFMPVDLESLTRLVCQQNKHD